MADKLITAKICAYCGEPFTPTRQRQKFCPRPWRCSAKARGELLRGVPPEAAITAKRAKDAALIQSRCLERFGPLSERETAIYAFADHIGYYRGYSLGYNDIGKKGAA